MNLLLVAALQAQHLLLLWLLLLFARILELLASLDRRLDWPASFVLDSRFLQRTCTGAFIGIRNGPFGMRQLDATARGACAPHQGGTTNYTHCGRVDCSRHCCRCYFYRCLSMNGQVRGNIYMLRTARFPNSLYSH